MTQATTSQTPIKPTMSTGDWSALIILSLLWGGSFFFVEVVVETVPTLTLVAMRVGLAALCLWVFMAVTGRSVPRRPDVWRAFLVMGLLNNVIPFSLIVWGQTEIASGLAAILNATTPVFTVLVAGFFLPDERPTPLKLMGVLFGFAGVAVMIGLPAMAAGSGGILFKLAILGAALSYAFAGTYGRRFRALGVDPLVTAAGQVTASTIILLPVALVIDWPLTDVVAQMDISDWFSVAGLAVLSTALAYVLYFRILASAGAVNLLLVTFLVPVSAIWLGVVVLGESLSLTEIAGMCLIALGLTCLDGRLWQRFRTDRHT